MAVKAAYFLSLLLQALALLAGYADAGGSGS
jgi:hypothetical protein